MKRKGKDIKKRDHVMRDNIDDLDVITKKRLLRLRKKAGRAINTVVGVVHRIEPNGIYAHVKWLGRHKTTRERVATLTTIRRKGVRR